MFQRRRPPQDQQRFRREAPNSTDRLVRQNDIIIRLLKEIRDRLPEMPVVPLEGEINDNAIAAPTSQEGWDEEQSQNPVSENSENNDVQNEDNNNAESNSSDVEQA